MALTRGSTGNARPRVFPTVATDSVIKRKTAAKRKPAAGGTTGGRVTKAPVVKKAPATHKRKPTVADKVKGAVKKVTGSVERKPGKKAAGTAEMRGHDGKKKKAVIKK